MKTELDHLIEFWKSFTLHNKCFLAPTMETMIKQTIDYLEKLKEKDG